MSNWKELPNEILCELFEQSRFDFSSRDLVECQLVCKNWRNHASFVLYRELVFYNCWHIGKFTECMQNSSLGSLVQGITFWCPTEDDIPNHDELLASFIYKLAEVCPNVEIFKGDLHANHWNALGEAARSYWKQLKQLPEPQWFMYNAQTAFVNYYTPASVYRRTLTHITLPPILSSSREFKRIFPLLKSFINLTHLAVTPTYDIPILMDFDEAISQCLNLMRFSIDSGLNMMNKRGPGYFKRYDVLSMQPHPKLKRLDVVTELHCDIFEYIMHKFPNLERCTRDYPEQLQGFQEYLSSRSCDRFCTYGSIPLIKEHLQRNTNPVVRISSTKPCSPLLEIQHDNTTWIIHNTVENIDRLKELLKYQNVIKKIYLNIPVVFEFAIQRMSFFRNAKG
ncbi:hypothetical protein RMATCC62417_16345 [Rhizopus microsporus]|nr:hypothetical protein RMATCC62417_16345 [Rhizopus microsporus]